MALEHDKAEREIVAFAPLVRRAMLMVLVEEVTAVIMQFVNRRFTSSLCLVVLVSWSSNGAAGFTWLFMTAMGAGLSRNETYPVPEPSV